MSVGPFLTRVFGSLSLCYLLASGIAGDASAQTHSSTQDGRRITIDESPSSEFVAQWLVELSNYFEPAVPSPNLPWCCYSGNYGGIGEASEEYDGTIPFYHITDEIFDVTLWRGPLVTAPGCTGTDCSSIWAYAGVFKSPEELALDIAHTFEQIPTYLPLVLTVNFGTYPAFIGPVGQQQPSPAVWSVTLSAAPEPSSAMLCLVAATMFGLRRRRAWLGHRQHAD